MNRYNLFLYQHVRVGAPDSTNVNEWEKFLGPNGLTGPTKSFLKYGDLPDVMDVCRDVGGRQYIPAQNLCISRWKFKFFTVRMNQYGIIYSVTAEDKYLILGCDDCLPVHFEANPNYHVPDINNRGCEGGPAYLTYLPQQTCHAGPAQAFCGP